jgi:hypothetical protein
MLNIKQLREEEFAEDDFESDVLIDVENFNRAVVQHSGLHYKYGKLYAIALYQAGEHKLHVETLARELEQTKARVSERLRVELAERMKVTESAIANATLQDKEYLSALERVQGAKREQLDLELQTNVLELVERIFRKRADLITALAFKKDPSDIEIMSPVSRVTTEAHIERLHEGAKAVIRDSRKKKTQRRTDG